MLMMGKLDREKNGRALRVVDGDTVAFKIHKGPVKKVRLADIDTPERDQPWGTEATTAFRQWLMSKSARIEVVDTDRYGLALDFSYFAIFQI